ncbi:Kinase superfamily isoform 4 isoform A [Micractinium conductrix]|uniref:Kinase superfamily isoform 4 isoform A n=1 Tax=Micractinium conductrix TaxID=554055 RepID=A0A2P6VLI0_9CHLO|nr:Kinase superfamily isoform 4 isoform A [Micractinium conductrix]|eukprot:PSC74948.1 Kinase superfamily isoform 4 isoform A [Micractinium conductrix]
MAAPEASQRAVGQWLLSTHIGAGSFAVVWKARHAATGAEAAVKEINLAKLNAKLRQSLESEVSILKRIRHGNIVQLLEVVEEEDRLYLVMEFCAGGDLAHFLRRVKRVSEATAQHFMRQLAAGLRQMWAHHLVHRDLKPQNLLLSAASPGGTLKIADFGFARNLQPQGLAETLCGSPLYMAPEILHFHKYDAKADLWSIGAILYEMVVGRPPFTGANQFQLLRNIERSDARVPEAIAATLSPPCRHLMHCLLRRNPVERLSFEEFFRHPFIATPEEAAAPLPPRAPFARLPLSGGIAHSLAGRGAAPRHHPAQQHPTLLFSTSAPAVAAAAAAAQRARAGPSAPQQVLGFQQQQQATAAARLAAGPAAGAAVSGGAVVPLGGLSHQLKPRRSLDLDAPGAASAAAAAAIQQHQAQRQQQQQHGRRGQPAASRGLGSVQRVQGFQPAPAPLPGQAAWSPGATLPAQQQQQQQPQQRQQQQQPQAQGPACRSVHSEDDDWQLVDTALSAHTVGRGSKPASPPLPPSRAPSEEGSLHTSRRSSGSTEEAIFAAHPGDSHAAATVALPWLAGGRWRRLHRAARMLSYAAAARAAAAGGALPSEHPLLRECLSLHLAALQVMEHALDVHGQALEAAHAAAAAAGGDADGAATKQLAATGAELQQEACAGMAAAELAAAALQKAGREPSPTAVTPAAAAAAAADAEAALPDPWELAFGMALAWGREAAVDELLGNSARSCRLYERAGTLLSFLCGEAPGLELEPPAELAASDRARLLQYAAAFATRWAACTSTGGGSPAGARPPS